MSVRRRWLALVALLVGGCATGVPIQNAADLGGEWKGRVTSPLGHAAATLTVTADGAFTATMYLDQGDRTFHGSLLVVRPGQVRYQGSDGNGAVRLSDDHGGTVMRFLRDDGGVDAVFRRF
jgi:hypothetical protein